MIEVEVRGRFLNPDGNPAKGTVSFTPRSAGASASENLLFPAVTVQARLDNDGRFRVTLRATDDPDTAPVDWTYRVAEQVGPSSSWRTYDIEVPSASEVAGIELADVAPVDPAHGEVTFYATLVALESEETTRAAADTALSGRLDDLEEGGGPYDPAGAAAAAQAAAEAASLALSATAATGLDLVAAPTPAAARTALGLGSASTQPSSAFDPAGAAAAAQAAAVEAAAKFAQWAGNPDALIVGTITRDTNGAATSAPVVWPDGAPGTYTATTVSAAFPGAVDAYTVTYGSPVARTYTQPAVTRNSSGAVTARPAIVVS